MGSLSIEIKARCSDPARVRAILKAHKARFKGLDHQSDTYFRVPSGRLKLREGDIENALIYYKRDDQKNSKRCDSVLYGAPRPNGRGTSMFRRDKNPDGAVMKKILAAALGVWIVVEKKREIYFIKNAKFHLDRVKRLGSFVEIEVFGKKSDTARIRKQCEFYQGLLGIRTKDLLADSYSDQLLKSKRM